MLITKMANKEYVKVGDAVEYKITVTNNNPFTVTMVVVQDILEDQLKFVENTLKIDGNIVPGNLEAGLFIGQMAPGNVKEVSFEAEAISADSPVVPNQAKVTYSYVDPNTNQQEFGEQVSNIVDVNIYDAQLDLIKQQDRTNATLGEGVNYTITAFNSGTIDLFNVIIKDALNIGLEIDEESITVNGQQGEFDLEEGILIQSLPQGETATITFTAVVKGGCCSPCISNTATAEAMYAIPTGEIGSEEYVSNTSYLYTGITCFKQFMMRKSLSIPMFCCPIEEINDISGTIEITDSYEIDTMEGESVEGQILTGRKWVVNGEIRLRVNYTALEPTQSVRVEEYAIMFGSFLVAPNECGACGDLMITGEIENIQYSVRGPREISVGISILLRG